MVIGITGRIGSGKTTVAKIYEKLGAVVIDADKIGHKLLEKSEIIEKIKNTVGEDVIVDGKVDRARLSKKLFSNRKLLFNYNKWIQPLMESEIKKIIEENRNKTVVVDAAILYRWRLDLDYVIMVRAPEDMIIERLKSKGLSPEEIKKKMEAQWNEEQIQRIADFIIDNDGTLEDLERIATNVWYEIHQS